MPQNDFLPVAIAGGANVETQAAYAGSGHQLTGFPPGMLLSAQLNKVLRQGTIGMALLADFIGSKTEQDTLDNGDMGTLLTNFIAAIVATALAGIGFTPVQQGGGANQQSNKLFLGWDNTHLRLQVDSTDEQELAFLAEVQQETARAITAENNLNAEISSEVTNRGTAVNAEMARAITAENNLDAEISSETTNRGTAVNAEATARTNADNALQTNINSEITRAENAEAAIDATIAGIIAGFTSSASGNGSFSINVPGAPGGRLFFQWMDGPSVTESGDSQHAGSWPTPFNSIWGAVCSTSSTQPIGTGADTDIHVMMFEGIPGYDVNGWNVRHSVGGVYAAPASVACKLFAWGN